jgi:hypothetical protein
MQEWNYLAAMIGENVTEAYCRVMSSKNAVDKETALSFKMKRRDAVRLSDARINKAETRLMYDRNGEYRAEQIYHIDNQKEPYLDVFLPKGASVWDVRFFTAETWQIRDSLQNNPNQIRPEGTPVKPCLMPYNLAATYEPKLAVKFDRVENSPEPVYENGVRIPLIKTDSGDLDYVIRIVYAGASSGLGNFSSMEMPFVKVLNVPVGTSLLKLYLPQSYKYHFSGNLQHINKEQSTTVIQKINESYTQQLGSRLQKTIEEGNLYEQQRAFSNIKNFEILNDANNNAFDDSKMMPQSQLQMPQSQIVQQIQPQNDMNANLAVNDNSGMLRNQFAIQSNSITTQNINRKSIKVENTTPQSSKNNNNVSAGTFIDSWVEDLNDVNEDEDEDVNIANTLSPINNSRESNTKAKALEKSASRVKNSITGDSSKKQNLNTSQRSQAVYEGNLVLGERSQIERQLEVGKMSGDDNSRSSSTGRVRSHSSGLVSPIPESDAKLFNQRPENLLIVNGSETQRDNKGVRASSGSVSPINNDKAVDSSSTSDSIGMTFGSHVENDNSSSKRRVAGANTNAENGSFLEESSFSGNIVAGRDELNKSIGGREERYRNFGSGGFGGNGQLNSLFISGERQAVEVQSLSTRMSGLDIDVPYKGELHIFTTPQGSLDLSFRAMSDKTGSRVVWFFVSLFCLGVIYFAYKGCLIVGKRFRLR